MGTNPARTIAEYFSSICDPRVDRRKLHKLTDIIALCIVAVLGSADGWEEIEMFGRSKEEWLRTFLELPNGIPSHDTIGRVMQRIDSEAFERCFVSWVMSLRSAHGGAVIAIDGKTLRHSFDTAASQSPIHLVSAYAVDEKLVLGQQRVDSKSNEITAIPALLDMLDISGATITIDAMGCQKDIAASIRDKGADYVLALKDNHHNLFEDVKEFFENKEYTSCSTHTTTEAGHGRIEERTCTITSDLAPLCLKNEWKDLAGIGMVEARREVNGKTSVQKRYYLTSHRSDSKLFASNVREHWAIENSFHWVMDVTLHEDDSRIRAGHGAQNFAILRRIAYNLAKAYKPAKPLSTKRKLKLAFWSHEYIMEILLAQRASNMGN